MSRLLIVCGKQNQKGNQMGRKLLTIQQVTEQTDLCRTTIYYLIKRGELHSIRIGRAVRIPRASLDEWIQNQLEQQNDLHDESGNG